MTTDSAAAHRTIDAVWRIESARIIAGLARLVRDVGLAEELAHLDAGPGVGHQTVNANIATVPLSNALMTRPASRARAANTRMP